MDGGNDQDVPLSDLGGNFLQSLEVCGIGWPNQRFDMRRGLGDQRSRLLQGRLATAQSDYTSGSGFGKR